MDKDLSSELGMEEAAAEMHEKGIRTIILSTSIGITKYNKEVRSEAISGKRLLTANRAHVMRAIEIAKEQHTRGLKFWWNLSDRQSVTSWGH